MGASNIRFKRNGNDSGKWRTAHRNHYNLEDKRPAFGMSQARIVPWSGWPQRGNSLSHNRLLKNLKLNSNFEEIIMSEEVKHERVQDNYGGEGIEGWIEPVCSCGWVGRKRYQYDDYMHTNAREDFQHHKFIEKIKIN